MEDVKEPQARIDKAIEYIHDKIQKSFRCDYGLSNNSADRMFTETVIELQIIDYILQHGYLPTEGSKDGDN